MDLNSLNSLQIELNLPDGNPDGLIIITEGISSLEGYCCNRNSIDSLDILSNDKHFLYFLMGNKGEEKTAIYVGESLNIYNRMYQHNIHAESFWTRCFIFTSEDRKFDTSTAQFLELEFYKELKKSININLKNRVSPKGASLKNHYNANQFKSKIYMILTVFGFNFEDEYNQSEFSVSEESGINGNSYESIKDFYVQFWNKLTEEYSKKFPDFKVNKARNDFRQTLKGRDYINYQWWFLDNPQNKKNKDFYAGIYFNNRLSYVKTVKDNIDDLKQTISSQIMEHETETNYFLYFVIESDLNLLNLSEDKSSHLITKGINSINSFWNNIPNYLKKDESLSWSKSE